MLHHRVRKTATAALAAALLLPVAGGAQEAGGNTGAEATPQQQKTRELVQEYRQTAEKLKQIRQEAVAANPELGEQSREFQDQIEQAMDESDYDVEAGQEKLQEMGKRYKSGDLSEEDRQKLATEFQAERQKMEQAKQEVMQQEEIRTQGAELQEDILTAMKEHDPQTEDLLQRLRELRQELQAMQSGAPGSQDG